MNPSPVTIRPRGDARVPTAGLTCQTAGSLEFACGVEPPASKEGSLGEDGDDDENENENENDNDFDEQKKKQFLYAAVVSFETPQQCEQFNENDLLFLSKLSSLSEVNP